MTGSGRESCSSGEGCNMTLNAGVPGMSSENGDFAPIRFSTDDVPLRDRVAVWREVVGRKIVRLDLEPLSDRPFHSRVYARSLPGLSFMSGVISDQRVARTRELIAD